MSELQLITWKYDMAIKQLTYKLSSQSKRYRQIIRLCRADLKLQEAEIQNLKRIIQDYKDRDTQAKKAAQKLSEQRDDRLSIRALFDDMAKTY